MKHTRKECRLSKAWHEPSQGTSRPTSPPQVPVLKAVTPACATCGASASMRAEATNAAVVVE
ncbi:hypothetical protein TRAPUB_4729 [Trametes pubescens]|uniref:Uncharacterized protein n=1 Tax=Trametes pubescens TaxID=154538 RepID=A0A1M2VA65_TRAPU|nr:hypothetical protein TRAPUB_4729 [Trametes pubescens]